MKPSKAIEQGIEDLAGSSPTCVPPRSTSSACIPRSRRCSTAAARPALILSELELPGVAPAAALDPELETTIYRLVQEALTNVVKHADANIVRVSVNVASEL